jgi:LPS-assembly protein
VSYQPSSTYTFSTRFRFDQATLAVQRFEVEARANFDRWSLSTLYGQYAAQPELGFLKRREGILGTASVKLTRNWVANAALRYDIDASKFSQTQFGIGYIDDCLIVALNYVTNYTYSGNPTQDHRFMLQLGLRTLGGSSLSQTVSTAPSGL